MLNGECRSAEFATSHLAVVRSFCNSNSPIPVDPHRIVMVLNMHWCISMDTPYDIQERTFLFARRVVDFCRGLSNAHPVTRAIGWQLLKAATSVGANTEEADVGQTKPDFRAKISIARKETRETHSWLRLLAATDTSVARIIPPLLDEAGQIAAILTAIKKSSDSNDDRG